jgi:hypothetical protein
MPRQTEISTTATIITIRAKPPMTHPTMIPARKNEIKLGR